MIDWVAKYWIEFLFSVIIGGGSLLVGAVRKKLIYQHKEQESIKFGIQALLRDRIIQVYNRYTDEGFIPIYAMDNVKAMYEQYHILGGNGTVTELMERLDELPSNPPK